MSQHELPEEMSKTLKKIYAASSNATSSSRLCKSVEDFSRRKHLFGKANHALLLAAEEIYGISLRKSELFMRLRCRPSQNLHSVTDTDFRKSNFFRIVKRFIEVSLSALLSLKTSKATRQGLAFREERGEDLISNYVNQIQS